MWLFWALTAVRPTANIPLNLVPAFVVRVTDSAQYLGPVIGRLAHMVDLS